MTHELERLIGDIEYNKHLVAIHQHNSMRLVKEASDQIIYARDAGKRVDNLMDELHNTLFCIMLKLSHRKFMRLLKGLDIG